MPASTDASGRHLRISKPITTELTPGGEVALSTPRKRKRSYMEQTNDGCERMFGLARVAKRKRGQERNRVLNRKRRWNGGHTGHQRFVAKFFTPEMHRWARRQARREEAQHEERNEQLGITAQKHGKMLGKRAKRLQAACKAAARAAEIAAVVLRTAAAATLPSLLSCTQKILDAQIDRLRSIDKSLVAAKSSFTGKGEEKIKGEEKQHLKA
jgi:hypothetical protein